MSRRLSGGKGSPPSPSRGRGKGKGYRHFLVLLCICVNFPQARHCIIIPYSLQKCFLLDNIVAILYRIYIR